jgi:hypothetical protein
MPLCRRLQAPGAAVVQPPAPASRKDRYVSRPAPARRVGVRALWWVAATTAGVVAVGLTAAFGVPLAARASVGGLRLVLDGVLWLALAISTGSDMWTIAGTAGRAVAATFVTPQALGGTGGLLVLGAMALIGLRRLLMPRPGDAAPQTIEAPPR